MDSSDKSFLIGVKSQDSLVIFIIKVIAIILGVLLVIIIASVIICYCFCVGSRGDSKKNQIANMDMSSDIFPAIKYSILSKYILEKPVKNKLIFELEE